MDSLGRPEVFSPAVLGTALLSSIVVLLAVDYREFASNPRILGVDLVTLAPSAVIIALGWTLSRRVHRRGARAAVAFSTYSLAINAKFSLAALLNAALGQPTRPIAEAFVGQGTAALIAVLIASRIAAHRADHLALAAELQDEQRGLLAASAEFEERVAAAQQSLTDRVAAELAPTVTEIRVKLQRLEADEEKQAREAIDTLSRAVSDVVRPMSHSLLLAESSAVLERKASTAPRPHLDLLNARIDLTRILNIPFLIALELMEAMVWGPTFRVVSTSVVGDVLTSLLAGFTAGAIVAIWPHRWRQMSLLRAISNLLAIYGAVVVLPRVALHHISPEVFYNPYLVAHLVDRGGLLLLFTFGGALAQVDAQTRAELGRVNRELEVLVARLRRELGAHRKRLSWLLHGPIQSALVSAAIGLSRGDRVDVAAFNARIDDAVAQIHSGYQHHRDLDQAISQITGVWSEAMAIEVSVAPEVQELLDREPSICEAAAEVLTEATSNAFRHGAATEVGIDLKANANRQLVLRVVNNGKPLDPDHSPGLGTRLLDELCLHWSLKTEDGRTALSAVLV